MQADSQHDGATVRAASPLRRHRFAFAFLFVLVLTIFVQPLARHEVFVLRDHFDYFQPLRWFTAEELKEGRLPFWNPYSASGEPWLANPQTGVFYPPAWLFLALPFPAAYMLFLFAHLVVLGWGAYLLFERSVARGAALVGAVALVFSGPILSLLDVSNNLATLTWLPLALWCAAARAWRRGGVVLALAFLGGEPFFAAVIALLYTIVALASRTDGLALRARIPPLLLAGLTAFGLSAVQLLPFVAMLSGSDRAGGLGAPQILLESMAPADWLRVVIPPKGAAGLDPALHQQFIPVVYSGISVALLALAGAVLSLSRFSRGPRPAALSSRREIAGWILLLVLCAFVAAGPSFLAQLPMSPFRYPARLVALAVFAIAALAAAGWDRVRRDRRWLDLLIVLVLLGDLVPRMRPLLTTSEWNPRTVPYAASVGSESKLLRIGAIDPSQRHAWVAGYLNLYDRRFDAGTAAPVASRKYLDLYAELIRAPSRQLVSSMGVGYVLSNQRKVGELRPVAATAGVVVHAIPSASELATFRPDGASEMPVAAWRVTTEGAEVSVDAPEPGLLMLRQQAARGWSVTVNGVARPVQSVNGMFLGVRLEKGTNVVVWRYSAPLFPAGAAVSSVTLLMLFATSFVKPSRRR